MAVTTLASSGLFGLKYRHTIPVSPSNHPVIVEPWQRPSDWLSLPSVSAGSQTLVGLYAVYDHDANFVAFTFAGAYTVDWGDGTPTENIASGGQADHNYVFSALSSSTLTSGGYRQAIITVTMQVGETFTSANLNIKHNQTGLVTGYSTGWLDIVMAGSSVNSFTLGGTTPVLQRLLQQFEYVGTSAITNFTEAFRNCTRLGNVRGTTFTVGGTNFTSMFQSCTSLQVVPLFDTANGTNFSLMFASCVSLRAIPLINTASGTTFLGMFNGCGSLQTIPLLNTAAGIDFSTTFANCSSLRTVPLINTANATTLNSAFANCVSLQSVPIINTATCTDFNSMFNNCSTLRSVPALNTSVGIFFSGMFSGCSLLRSIPVLTTTNGTNFGSMFQNCTSMQSIPLLNTANGTSFVSMFQGCTALQTIPLINTASGTNFQSMFQSCTALQTIPLLVTSAGITFTSMFNGCTALQTIPLLDTTNGTTMTTMFSGCTSLAVGAMSGTKSTISYASCKLSATELDRIYTNLASGVVSKTITVTSNWGTTGDTPSIATAKGWTVTGS